MRRTQVTILCVALLLSACGRASNDLIYTLPAGTIDASPASIWAKPYIFLPPEPDGSPFDGMEGMSVQAFADKLIGKHVADFVAHRWDYYQFSGDFSVFLTRPEIGPGAGMCSARRYFIRRDYSRGLLVKASDGEWLDNAYAVAGSLAPLAPGKSKHYGARLQQACDSRADQGMWFPAERPEDAYLGAQLADAVVAAARRANPLPFKMICTPFAEGEREKPICENDVRKSVASINPRAIVAVDRCEGPESQRCISIDLAKSPGTESTLDRTEDRWTILVRIEESQQPLIQSVEISDARLIIE